MKILFIGDIVGRMGRIAVENFLKDKKWDFVIANVENASHGFGLSEKNHTELIEAGIDCMTSGNHIWDKRDIFSYIDNSAHLIRPLNYHKNTKGVGYRIFNDKIIVINLLGKTFMQPVSCPFAQLEELSKEIDFENKIVIVDLHAEATAEKICFGHFASKLGVKAVLGTHTHIQTADEKIINSNCAYITDVGFCGAKESVIGMDIDISIRRMVTSIPERFDVAVGETSQINAVEITFDVETGIAKKIERIQYEENKGEN